MGVYGIRTGGPNDSPRWERWLVGVVVFVSTSLAVGVVVLIIAGSLVKLVRLIA